MSTQVSSGKVTPMAASSSVYLLSHDKTGIKAVLHIRQVKTISLFVITSLVVYYNYPGHFCLVVETPFSLNQGKMEWSELLMRSGGVSSRVPQEIVTSQQRTARKINYVITVLLFVITL